MTKHDELRDLMEPMAPVDIDQQPGYYIRRLHQISVAIFLQETEAFGVTPVQYAALQTVGRQPSIDQRTLARTIGLDTSTIAGVIDRLEARGLLVRSASPEDRRVRQLTLTDAARQLLADIGPAMLKAQQVILAPLAPLDQREFTRMLRQLVTANNELSRAPSDAGGIGEQK
jgi:DNA-binding MarR family transcriptional regulator